MTAIFVLLGPPGAGKGTQAVRLAEALSIPHISTGDLFRANLAEGTELGTLAKQYMNEGQLVPDEVVLDMLFARVAEDDCGQGYLLDGFPRTVPQAEAFDARVKTQAGGAPAVRVVNLAVDDEALLERLTGRLMCRACGRIHHKSFSPPKQAGQCDDCGGELYQRDDDKLEVVQQRLDVYHQQTQPLVEYYSAQGTLTDLDGSRAPDEVFAELRRHALEGAGRE